MSKKIFGVGVAALLIIFSGFFLPFIQTGSVKADHGDIKHPYRQARIAAAYHWFRNCSSEGNGYTSSVRSKEDMKNGNVFQHKRGNSEEESLSYLFVEEAPESSEFGVLSCTKVPNPALILSAIDMDAFEVFVDTGIFKGVEDGWILDKEKYPGNDQRTAAIRKKFEEHFPNLNFNVGSGTGPMLYFRHLAAFSARCVNGVSPDGSSAGVDVSIVSVTTGEINTERYILNSTNDMNCSQVVDKLNSLAEETSQAVSAAVAAGESVEGGPSTQLPGQTQVTQDCQSGSGTLGWIMCPIVTGALSLLEFIANPNAGNGILFDLLQIDVLDTSPNSTVSQVTDGFRTFANILLVIAFLFIIFTTSLSVGPEAYTVKKMLPKLIVAGILTQLSLFIGKFLIDLFNVIGYGIGSLILAPIESEALVTISGLFGSSSGGVGSVIGNITDGVLGGVGIIAAGGAALWMLLITLPTIAIAVAAVMLILGLRKIVIILMIVTMPIAFALYIFPATEKIAREWFDNLIKLLAMFPFIIALIAGGALLASMSGISESSTSKVNFIEGMVSIIALFGPYLLIPFTFKFAGRAFTAVTGGIQSLQSRATGGGRAGKAGGGAGAGWMQKYQNRIRGAQTTTAAGKGWVSGTKAGAPLRGLARPGTGITKRSGRNAQLAYAQSVMSGAKELSETDPEMMQNKELRRVMQYGSLKKAREQVGKFEENNQHEAAAELQKSIDEAGGMAEGRTTTRQQRASLLYASAASGDASVGDILGSSGLAGSDPQQHASFLNTIVGATNKKSGNLGASAGFEVGRDGKVRQNVSKAADKLIQADPYTMARDKHWGVGGATRTTAEHVLSNEYLKKLQVSDKYKAMSPAEKEAATNEVERKRSVLATKLRQTMSNAGADTQQNIQTLLQAHGFSSDPIQAGPEDPSNPLDPGSSSTGGVGPSQGESTT